MIRASSLDLLVACNGSRFLATDAPVSERAQAAREYGTAAHAYVEAIGDYFAEPAPVHAKLAEKLSVSQESAGELRALYTLPGTTWRELHLAYHPGTQASAVMVGGDWETMRQRFGLDWITGTADYVVLYGDQLIVDDLKTGSLPVKPTSWQLRFYALATWLALGQPTHTLASITRWPYYPKAGIPRRESVAYTAADHEKTAEAVRELAERPMTLSTGPQCRFCPSRHVCPALADDLDAQQY